MVSYKRETLFGAAYQKHGKQMIFFFFLQTCEKNIIKQICFGYMNL